MNAGLPLRTCIGCRAVKERDQLLRLVRRPDGTVEADPGGRLPGRGAYVCWSEVCLEGGLRPGRLSHAFREPTWLTAEEHSRLHRMVSQEKPGAGQGGEYEG